MNQDLQEAIRLYAVGSHQELNAFLLDKSKDNLIAIFNDLLTTYINDKNSSTLREYITTTICGYQHSEAKIGYNGYRQKTLTGEIKDPCEVKPKNIDSREVAKYKQGERKSKPSLLNGGGNFTDYTWTRFDKDIKSNPAMLVSGFVDGKLIYVFEFPFKMTSFTVNLKKQLERKFPKRARSNNDFLRGATFCYKDFIRGRHKIVFLLSKKELQEYKSYIDSKFFIFLYAKAK